MRTIALIYLFFGLVAPAAAYIGPGMGAGAIAALFGIISSVFLGIFAIVYYPIKRALKNRKSKREKQAD